MPFIILGRERFALPIGETRIGGSGNGALPFQELAGHAPLAVLLLRPDGAVHLRRLGRDSIALAVDGAPVGSDPVTLTLGVTIEAAGTRLVFGELRELRTTTHVMSVRDERLPAPDVDAQAEPTADSGGQLVTCGIGVVVRIPDSGLVIGRAPDSDLVMPAREVSRRHAVVRPSPQGYVLRDVSTNGTYINGHRVSGTRLLGMGDIIRIGSEEFRFEADALARPPEAMPPAAAPAPGHRPIPEPPTGPRSAAGLVATPRS